jgi:hypothetical protein
MMFQLLGEAAHDEVAELEVAAGTRSVDFPHGKQC